MKSARFEVLSRDEVRRIHAASMEILSTVGVQVDWKPARTIFSQAGAEVEAGSHQVRIPEELVQWAVDQAPERFTLYGPGEPGDAFRLEVGGENICFAGLGTPTHIIDLDSGERRPCTMDD
ncbi:MAG: trimethylamine methyltransferase family protein, partial [Anaerolineae bacterium]